jgi:hypothetical protein
LTSTAPTPGRPTRPCTAELLAAAELPATTAGTAVIGPKLPQFAGDDMLASGRPAARLQVTAVRLLGYETAVTDAGQRTLRMLSQTLRLPLFGTRKPLLKSHSNSAGFDPAFAHLRTEASATHPAFGRAGSRHGRHPHDRW